MPQLIKRFHSTLFFVTDLDKTEAFYNKLGFNAQRSEDAVRIKIGDYTWAFMDEQKTTINKEAGKKPKGVGIFCYVEVEGIDDIYNSMTEKGIITSSKPTDWPWGKREFAVKDPDGFKIIFYQPIKS